MKLSKRTIAVTTVVFALAGTGGALAFVSASGSGTGSGSTIASGSVQPVSVVPDTEEALEPGSAEDFVYTGNNPNNFKVTLKAPITIEVTGLPAGCAASNFDITQPTGLVISADEVISLAPGGSYGSVKLIEDTVDACLGITPSYQLTTGV